MANVALSGRGERMCARGAICKRPLQLEAAFWFLGARSNGLVALTFLR